LEINEEKEKEQCQVRLKDGCANANFKETFGHPKGTISKKL
jgi:hypothetical protein